MKRSLLLLASIVLSSATFGQGPNNNIDDIIKNPTVKKSVNRIVTGEELGNNGFEFSKDVLGKKVNSKYSEYGSGLFRNKMIIVSSKKIGGLSKVDKNSKEAYKALFCADIAYDGSIKMPMLFSRMLNTRNANEDQVAFSPDEHTIYFTRSTKDDSKVYKLHKSTLEKKSHGNWTNDLILDINKEGYSIENPFVSANGKELYFSSNMPGTLGGYDLFVAPIKQDGTLGAPKNLGETVNTTLNEKYPSLSKDGRTLFFASQGHINLGGYDVFKSNIRNKNIETPVNLGNTVNTTGDEVALFFISDEKGYISSNKIAGEGGFNIAKFIS